MDGDGRSLHALGHGLLTHEGDLTILGIWDSSGDSRPNSTSTFVAIGRYDSGAMQRLCAQTFPAAWGRLAAAYPQLKILPAAPDRPADLKRR